MRSGLFTMVFLVSAVPAMAQSALDGPLARPDDAIAAPAAAPQAKAKAKAKKARHAANPVKASPVKSKSAGATPVEQSAPDPTPAAPTGMAAPDAPVSLGMKWQGNNDSAAQTRYNNLNGDAFGSGAEVGMKLHF